MFDNEALIDNEVLEQIAQEVFATMLDIELIRTAGDVSDERLVANIQITGAWSGGLSLAFSANLARSAACRMLKLAPDEVTALDEHEVAAELANMIGGNLKSLLPSPSQLSLPNVGNAEECQTPSRYVTLEGLAGSLNVAVREFAK